MHRWRHPILVCHAWGVLVILKSVGFRVFPSRRKSMYIVEIWPTGVWLEAELCLPIYSAGVKADVFVQCLTTLVMGGNGPSRPGGILGIRTVARFSLFAMGL